MDMWPGTNVLLPDAIPGYVLRERLGSGGFGTVYAARARGVPGSEDGSGERGGEGGGGGGGAAAPEQTHVAVKVMKGVPGRGKGGVHLAAIRELALLQRLQHPNIPPVLGIHQLNNASQDVAIIMPRAARDLRAYLRARRAKDQPPAVQGVAQVKAVILQVAQALAYCHAVGVMHRDVKPDNVLCMGKDGGVDRVFLTDFGIARPFLGCNRPMSPRVTTVWYRAPEVLLGLPYGPAVDVWALGVLLVEVWTGACPFRGDSGVGQLFKLYRALGTPGAAVSTGVYAPVSAGAPHHQAVFPKWPPRDPGHLVPTMDAGGRRLLAGMLRLDARERWSAARVAEDPWLKGGADAEEEEGEEDGKVEEEQEQEDVGEGGGAGTSGART